MIDPIINGIVMAIFGLIIGGIGSFSMLLSGASLEIFMRGAHKRPNGEKKRNLLSIIRDVEERAKERRLIVKSIPRSVKLFMAAFYGLIIILVIIVKYSPLEMSWLVFIISILVGYIVVDRLFSFAREGKIHTKSKSRFDVLPDEKKEK